MTCLISGLDNRPGRFAHPRPGRRPPPIWDPPPPTPPGWDHVAGKMRTPPPAATAGQQSSSSTAPPAAATPARQSVPAAAASSLTSADLPLKPPKDKAKSYLGGFRQYACSEVSSEGSKWKKALQPKDGPKSMAQLGYLKNDLSYAHANTPGVCITRVMSLPNIPPPAQQEALVKFLKKDIRRKESEDKRARKAFAVQKELLANPPADGGDAGVSSEVLPKHQRKTAGKPAICRPMAATHEAMAKMMNAEDSHFTSEYRSHGWWKTTIEGQKKELKEHVRPYDGWVMFRDRAALQNQSGCCRFPINTY